MSSPNGSVAWILAAWLSVSLVTPGPARAERQDARRRYDRATAAFGLGKYEEAATEYEAAFELKPDPALLYNAAQAYRLAGRAPRAIQLYRNYLRLYGDAENADDARQHLLRLESASAEGRPAGPTTVSAPAVTAAPAPTPAPVAARPPARAGSGPRLGPPGSSLESSPAATAAAPTAGVPIGASSLGASGRLLAGDRSAPESLARSDAAGETTTTTPPLTSRPVFWVALAAALVVGGAVLLLSSRSGDQDPKATLGMVNAN
jgi:tetratricopeptide (TPR) repeat protein